MKVGLRVDVDTYTGTRIGLPQLLDILGRYDIRASFFFSTGPDNMGRHLLRLFRRDFLVKMFRSRAASLYGLNILFRGTLWPGPVIAPILGPHLRRAAGEGHEIGLHAWDHHRRQRRAHRMSAAEVVGELERGQAAILKILGKPPRAFAAPSWKCTDALLEGEENFAFHYGSDCRGIHPFRPVVGGKLLSIPQIPVTLPTYDEVIGRDGITDRNYNDYLLGLVKGDAGSVLAVHAEVEGMRRHGLFQDLIEKARRAGLDFVPLGTFLPADLSSLPAGSVGRGSVPGREGWVAVQETVSGGR